jgi:hypothetical protein
MQTERTELSSSLGTPTFFEWEPELLALPSLHLPTAIEWG